MKIYITLLINLLISVSTFAQQGINYKAILKDTNGNLLAGTFMNVQFTIHEDTATGTIVYQEDHNYTTDANGLLIHNIGTEASPSVGIFTDIDWGTELHFLQITITYSGGTINFDATEFMAVPYAKHAQTAANVFSGNYYDLSNRPNPPSGLQAIDEGSNDGWRLIGEFSAWHGDIGNNAVDLSIGVTLSETQGATGSGSFAAGYGTTASGIYSTATGLFTEASGSYSMAMGRNTKAIGGHSTAMGYENTAHAYGETVIGVYSTNYDPNISEDRLFSVGNGTNLTRNNALTILKNGNAIFDAEIQHISTGSANMIPIAYGTVESNGNILTGTGNFTASVNSNVFTINVNGETLSQNNTVCSITPFSTAPRTSSIIVSGGNLNVRIFNSSGTQVATTFQFLIYKL